MRIAIIQFPGSNCERETMLAVQRAGMQPLEFLWNQAKADLAHFDGYILVGGFSYEDRSRSGIIAALDPLMPFIQAESEKGKPVLGICNGAQILVECGLVPGLKNYQLGAALTNNKRLAQGKILGTGFYNAWIHMRLADQHQRGAFTRHLTTKQILELPVAHAEGRFIIPPLLLAELQKEGLTVFQYCDAAGNIQEDFPVNPNGSVHNIAALSNKSGNVMAIMPHPERTSHCDAIFTSMRDYIAEGNYKKPTTLHYQAEPDKIPHYSSNANARELVVELMITDNHTMSVDNELKRSNLPFTLKRQTHWEIECDSPATYEAILASGALYNNRKEFLLNLPLQKPASQVSFLVRSKENLLGQEKKQILERRYAIKGIQNIRQGTLWRVSAHENLEQLTQRIITSTILFNPYAHDCYYY